MNKSQLIKRLLLKADKESITAQDMFKLGHYDWCLFMWHLAIELILKAKITSNGDEYPYTHDLVRLAKAANIPMDKSVIEQLYEITTYNVEARYDSEKSQLYKKATKEYTSKWSKTCKDILLMVQATL